MIKLMRLEWKKLKQKSVISEVIIYLLVVMLMPMFFIKLVSTDFGQSYTVVIELISAVQVGMILFGASLISQVFIDEYKNKTITLSFGYPISREKLFAAKILFIATFVFLLTMLSHLLTGVVTYTIDQVQPMIDGDLSRSHVLTFLSQMIVRSLIITLISFVPLFYFGILKKAVVPTVICAIVLMQLNLAPIINLNVDLVMAVLCGLGGLSIFLSIMTADKFGEV